MNITESCRRTAGGVAIDLIEGFCDEEDEELPDPPIIAFEPILLGKVCDLLITPKLLGLFVLIVNFLPEAINIKIF